MSDRKREKLEEEDTPDELQAEETAEEDEQVQEAIKHVQDLQTQLDKINEESADRVLAIEQEFSQKRRPVYKERNAALQRIPNFWCITLAKHPNVGTTLTEDDIGVLNHCIELEVEDYEDIKSGFKITLTFEGNPYFSNRHLSKSFTYAENGALTIKGTQPDWSPEMAPSNVVDVSRRGKRGQHPAHEYRFMLWFMDEELEPGSHDELADIIREDIWPSPLKFYQQEEEEEEEELDLDNAFEVEEGEGDDDEAFAEQQEFDEAYGAGGDEVGGEEEALDGEALIEEEEGGDV